MERKIAKSHTGASLRIVFIYALVGALWIFFSDSLLGLLVQDHEAMKRIAIAKGWLYVAVTATLLFLLIRRAMNALSEAEDNQARTEASYRTLFEHSGDALMVHAAPDWALTDANPAAVRLFGFPDLATFLECNPADLSPPTQPDGEGSREKSETMLKEAFELGSRIFRWRCQRRDGTQFDAIVRLTRTDFHGAPSILAAVRDLTEFNKAEEERKEMERRLVHAQKLESLGVLVSGIAHDFNNLITAASGNLELAQLSGELPENAGASIDLSKSALKRASQLTRQMLDYTRKSRQAGVVSEFSVNSLISENTELIRAILPKRISIKLDLQTGISNVRGDPGQMHQVLMNLLTNAAESITDAGEISIRTFERQFGREELARGVLQATLHEGGYVGVEIRDTGAGMDEETRARMFEPFYTTKVTGRGLGMSVVMSIVEHHLGALLVDSLPGVGTTMTILLRPLPQLPHTAAETGRRGEAGEMPTAKAILLAEDEEKAREAYREMLTLLGYETIEAADGADALKKWKANASRISAALVDVNMPGMNGTAFLEEMRRLGGRTPVILTSGMGAPPVETVGRYSGYLKKPFSTAELGMSISMALAEAE